MKSYQKRKTKIIPSFQPLSKPDFDSMSIIMIGIRTRQLRESLSLPVHGSILHFPLMRYCRSFYHLSRYRNQEKSSCKETLDPGAGLEANARW